MEELRVVPERDRMVAARFREVAGELDAQQARTASALAALGTPWGTAGARFAEGYLSHAREALLLAGDLVLALDGAAARLTEGLERTDDADRAVGESFRTVRSPADRAPR